MHVRVLILVQNYVTVKLSGLVYIGTAYAAGGLQMSGASRPPEV